MQRSCLTNQTAAIRNNRPSFPDKLVEEGFFLLVYKLPVNPGLNIDFIITVYGSGLGGSDDDGVGSDGFMGLARNNRT